MDNLTAIPYREVQGNTGKPCNESWFFPVGIDLQGLGLQC